MTRFAKPVHDLALVKVLHALVLVAMAFITWMHELVVEGVQVERQE